MKITSRFDGHTLYECDADILLATLHSAVASGANLSRADLSGADLIRADLTKANLFGADLSGAILIGADLTRASLTKANLAGADLSGAILIGADLTRADLAGAILTGAKIPWRSHATIAEILRRAAGEDVRYRMMAGLVLISRDWCWEQFLFANIEPTIRDWALAELRRWVQPGDDAPDILRQKTGSA